MRRLRNPVRHHAWGSLTAIPDLLGESPDGRPHAEMWLGGHPSAPSQALGPGGVEVPLDARLPFLLKVLAAAEPLSLQVHPTKQQALAGFAAEERRGVARDAADRSYPDDNHKPEMLCALTPFRLVAGFRPVEDSRDLLASLDVDELADDVALLARSGMEGVRGVLERWLRLDADVAAATLARVLDASAGSLTSGTEFARELTNVVDLGARCPGDVGVLVLLLLAHLELAPGEALFVPSGALHTYLNGVGIEIQASSDNVVRAGLTSKHVDPAAVLDLVEIAPNTTTLLRPRRLPNGEEVYDAPVDDFRLSRLTVRPGNAVALSSGRPQILLAVEGEARLDADGDELTLPRGTAVFVDASEPDVRVRGEAVVFRATTGARV